MRCGPMPVTCRTLPIAPFWMSWVASTAASTWMRSE